jgi:predicted O-linked N-acetylglucosamine transferase (SPINDLY family)
MASRGGKPNPVGGARTTAASALVERARRQARDGKRTEAEATLRQVIAAHPTHREAHFLLSEVLCGLGKRDEAVVTLRAIATDPTDASAHHRLGVVLREAGRLAEAEFALRDAIAASPTMAEAHLELSNVLIGQRQTAAAEAALRQAIAIRPDYAAGHYNLGNLLRQAGRLSDAVAAYEEATTHNAGFVEAWFNLAITLRAMNRFDDALASYGKVLALRPQFAEALNNMGVILRALGRYAEAEDVLRAAAAAKPNFVNPHYNLGGVLGDTGRVKEAAGAFRTAISVDPDYASAYVELGNLLRRHELYPAAEQAFRKLLERKPRDRQTQLLALEGIAKLHKDQEQLPEAAATFERMLAIDPMHAEAMFGLFQVKGHMCDWRNRDEDFARLMVTTEQQIARDERTALTSFTSLALPLTPAQHLAVARTWANDTMRQVQNSRRQLGLQFDRSRRHDRIRIGYVSQDFRNQAMGHLTRSMYGLHDRSRFEIFGYSVRKDDGSSYRKTIAASCDHFADIHNVSALEAARRIYADEIDIMVDLMGFTEGNRMTITALHPAPVTVGFLRFPGSSGADFVDYMFTDRITTTPEDQKYYPEQLVFLPNCYQPNDWTQEIDASPITRAEVDLPADAFVFSCFNNHYKIEPFIFSLWMRILHQVPNSVLWLMGFNSPMQVNLKREAEARGIAGDRIIFTKKIGKARHLARQRLADLFLDTRYYTSHTTASDALWGGLPVLTCPSDSFASRVTASLLSAAGLPEMIVPSFEEYERRAVHLATHPAELKSIRDKWTSQRTTCALFDTKRFVRNLERAYRLIWDDYAAGRSPRPLFVSEADLP